MTERPAAAPGWWRRPLASTCLGLSRRGSVPPAGGPVRNLGILTAGAACSTNRASLTLPSAATAESIRFTFRAGRNRALKVLLWIIMGLVGVLLVGALFGSGSDNHRSARSEIDKVQWAEADACEAAKPAGRECNVCIHVAFGAFVTDDNRVLSRALSEAEKNHIQRNAVQGTTASEKSHRCQSGRGAIRRVGRLAPILSF